MPKSIGTVPLRSSLPGEDQAGEDEASRWGGSFFLIYFAVFLLVAVNCAWICDDAYIGFRVADNFAHGYGLTWNVAERVQVYTAPLWILVVSLVNVATREVYYTAIVLGLAMSTVAVVLLAWPLSRSPANGSLVMIGAMSSKAFMDYATSGLENPLGYLLLAGFCLAFFRGASAFRLSLLGTLVVFNRADGALLVAPPILLALALRARWRDLAATALGAIPFLLWEGFALFYYGSLVPNTAYAKISTGIPRLELVRQGSWYFVDSLTRDPVTLALIALALIVTALGKDARSKSLAMGISSYLTYVAWIGGDFMSGRFFSLPFVAALGLLAVHPLSTRVAGMLSVATLTLGLAMPRSPLLSTAGYGSYGRDEITNKHGIADERAFYYPSTGLWNARPDMSRPFHPWAQVGESTRLSGRTLMGRGNMGFTGYFAGPGVYIVDPGALGDALLARLRLDPSAPWRIGHFRRQIPEGYLETLASGENQITDPAIARFYDRLRLVISGPLSSRERLVQVVRLVTGVDRAPTDAGAGPCRVTQEALTKEVPFSSAGVEIDLGRVCHAAVTWILLDNNDSYRIVFLLGRRSVGERDVAPDSVALTPNMINYHVSTPMLVAREGFDRIRVWPVEGDGYYAIGGVSLPK
jgi:arabinofuranosyltransferase